MNLGSWDSISSTGKWGTSLVVQQLGICLPVQGARVQSLVGELRSYMLLRCSPLKKGKWAQHPLSDNWVQRWMWSAQHSPWYRKDAQQIFTVHLSKGVSFLRWYWFFSELRELPTSLFFSWATSHFSFLWAWRTILLLLFTLLTVLCLKNFCYG